MNREHVPLLSSDKDSFLKDTTSCDSTGTSILANISEESTDCSVFTELDFLERQSNLTERQSNLTERQSRMAELNQELLHEDSESSTREHIIAVLFSLFGVLLIAFIILLGSDLL